MFFGKLIALAAGAASLVASTSARPVVDSDVTYANTTLEARTLPLGWSTARCKKVSGSLGFGCWKINYNLGCVCYEDIDAYCDKMNYPPIVTNYLKGHFALDMPVAKNYPVSRALPLRWPLAYPSIFAARLSTHLRQQHIHLHDRHL